MSEVKQLTAEDFGIKFTEGGRDYENKKDIPSQRLDTVKPETVFASSNIDLEGSGPTEKECPCYKNLVFKAIDNYEWNSDVFPIQQYIETCCKNLKDGICVLTGNKCFFDSSYLKGIVFSDDQEKMVEVAFYAREEE
jgi:hypothetical protein